MAEGELEASLEELKRLVQTLGFKVVGTLIQKRSAPSPATAVGAGKLKELARWTGGSGEVPTHQKAKTKAELNSEESENTLVEEIPEPEPEESEPPTPTELADKVIFDHELTPNQLKNLEAATGAEILDRTGVIVEIFHRHAKTREARAQVEIARLNYLAPRLRATGGGERQGGGIGSKGVGETSYELDRRRIRDRVAELQAELLVIHEDNAQRRLRRREQLRVALVGYTNAGKSSLMRALTGSEVLVADKLFATLDTTIRTLQPDVYPRILVSDTVGFIKKLPHDLVASFRSTLDEAKDASLLLYVVDASDGTFRSQLELTQQVLAEIDASDIPSRVVLNKIDRLSAEELTALGQEFPEAIFISTRNPEDISRMTQVIRDFLTADLAEADVLVPYDHKTAIGEIRRNAAVLSENYDEKGVHLKIRAYPEILEKFQKLLSKEST